MNKKNHFTLVELLVVIGIIAILAGIVMGALMGASNKAEDAKAKSEISDLKNAIAAFDMEYGKLPKPKGYNGKRLNDDQYKWLIYVLQGEDANNNSEFKNLTDDYGNPNKRMKQFINSQSNEKGVWNDPWGKRYQVIMEKSHGEGINNTGTKDEYANEDGVWGLYAEKVSANKSTKDKDKRMLYYDCIIWSLGKDGKQTHRYTNTENQDNLYSVNTVWNSSTGQNIQK